MNKKKLIFDVVFITENEKVFELRFKNISEKVDYFLFFGTEENLFKIEKFYKGYEKKVKTFLIDNDSFDFEFISSSILNYVGKLYNSFDDLILFSFSNEIPDLDSIDEILTKSKDVNVIVSEVYENDLHKKRKYPELGPVLINFSNILRNKKIFITRIFDERVKKFNEFVIYNGFKIINYETNLTNLPSTYTCPYSDKKVEYKNESTNRKFVFLLDTQFQDFTADFIFEIEFVNNFPEDLKIDFDKKHQKLKLFLPKKPLYSENFDDFSITYKTKEIKRILSLFNCQLDDDVEIHFENDEIKKYKFKEIENPSF
jgi:hypothetical protein